MRLPFLCTLLLSAAYATDYLRPCYFTNWAHYRQGDAKYVPENYTTGLCTHIFFAFGTFGSDFKAKAFDEADLPGWAGDGMYSRVNALKKNDPNLKTILSFGGWNFGTALFKQMAASAENRNTFITSALAFIDQWGFDGIDIDWEYPAGDDKANFAALMSEMKAAAGSKYFITAAVSADPGKIDAGYDVQSLASSLDFVNVMTYDYQDTSKTSQNSPLFGGWNSGWNSANALDHWNKQGMPKEKLLMGIGTYGHGFTLADPNNFGMGAPASPAPAEPITQQGGFGAYYEICPRLAQGAKRFWDDEQKVPYLVKDSLWYGYDDVESISTKMEWIKQNGYAGAFTWCLDMDDFFGACGDKYPLHNAIKNGLGGGGIVIPAPPPTDGPTNNPPTNNSPTQKPTGGPFSCPGDGFFSDPADCTGYYQCANGTPFHFQCSAGTEWNQKVLTCDWPGNTACFSKKR